MAAARHQLDWNYPRRRQNGPPTSTPSGAIFGPTATPIISGVLTAATPTTIIVAPSTTTTTSTTIATEVSTTTHATATSSTAKSGAKDGSSNMGTLIPAIVAPVAAVLLIGFGIFWWIMRRRAQKALAKEPEFVMEKRRNVRKHSRDDSTHSSSSTRKLVSKGSLPEGMNKEAAMGVRELPKGSLDLFQDNRRAGNGNGNGKGYGNGYAVGLATSPEHTPIHSRNNSAEAQNPSGPPAKAPVAVRNFSRGPSRPSTANQDRDPGSAQYQRDRSMSIPGSRPPPPPGRSDPRRPPPNMASNNVRTSPSRSGPRPQHEPSLSRSTNVPPAIETRNANMPQKSTALSPPTPTGAYNGASPISQYSPIIKGTNKLGTSPPKLSLDVGPSDLMLDTPTTPQMTTFTEENMRIARLADSSRLGFYKDTSSNTKHVAPTIATSVVEESYLEPPNPSPRLPPPVTRELRPLNFPPPPPPPADSPAMPSSNSRRADSFMNDRRSMRSMVSRLSDGEYVDMEVDAKSDVSSLDERERWEMEQQGSVPGQHPAFGSRPPMAQGNGSNNAGNGSQYSLGRY